MAKNKLKKFKENKTFHNLIQPKRDDLVNDNFIFKGKWNEEFFKNDRPIILELGCGKGDYTIGLAKENPDKNFIGVDIKGARLWTGAKIAIENSYKNAAFLRSSIEFIPALFEKNEVSEIWITFPDPQIKFRRAKHRLTHPDFLEKYHQVLKEDGIVHLKTDSEFLHGYTLGVLQMLGHEILISNHDVYNPSNKSIPEEVTKIKTYYESKFLEEGKLITYIRFKLNY